MPQFSWLQLASRGVDQTVAAVPPVVGDGPDLTVPFFNLPAPATAAGTGAIQAPSLPRAPRIGLEKCRNHV